MWRNALAATALTVIALVIAAFNSVDYLIPYKRLLFAVYWKSMIVYILVLSVNLFVFWKMLAVHFLLKRTGSKLGHVRKQLRDGSIPGELADRLARQ